MSNGNNVPDDCRNSDHWDDNGITCPICDEAMTITDNDHQAECDSNECDFVVDLVDGEGADHE